MSSRSANKSFDWIVATIYGCLLVIGWLMLYATVYTEENPKAYLDLSTTIGKQSLWIGISLVTFIIVYAIDWKVWNTFAYPLYIGSIILLVLVLLIGSEIKGARSWFTFARVGFQPSEIAKFGTALAVSSYLSLYKTDIGLRKTLLTALGILFVPILLILLQPDAGSAIVFSSILIVFYKKGLSELYFILGFAAISIFILSLIYDPQVVTLSVALIGTAVMIYNMAGSYRSIIFFIVLAAVAIILFVKGLSLYAFLLLAGVASYYLYYYFQERDLRIPTLTIPAVLLAALFSFGSRFAFDNGLEKHQQERINVWLNPEKCDPRGSLYNIIQSKLAIGSGGFEGKGFLQGNMTKLNFVPEQTTDFIFSTVGEEQGFIGTLGVIFLFTLLLVRIVIIAERAKNEFISNYAYCVAGIIFIHFFVNVGMSVGLMPVIGIPLPFLSKGGSALLGFTIMIAALLKMDTARFRGA